MRRLLIFTLTLLCAFHLHAQDITDNGSSFFNEGNTWIPSGDSQGGLNSYSLNKKSHSLPTQFFRVGTCDFEIISEEEQTIRIVRGDYSVNMEDGRTYAVIPSSVTYLGVDYTVVEIGEQSYMYCRANVITIPNTVKRISNEAFENCFDIEEIKLPEGLEFIGDRAFGSPFVHHEIHIPASVRYIGKAPFLLAGTTHLTVDAANPYYDSREGCNAIIETATDKLIQGCAYTVIPESVTSIGVNAFGCYDGLENISIPQSVRELCDSAFMWCYNLEKIELRNGLKSIGNRAFCMCPKLKSLIVPRSVDFIGINALYANNNVELSVENGNPYYDSREACNAVISTRNDSLIQGSNLSHIPSTVRQIGFNAFCGCLEIKDICLPEGLTAICDSAFTACYNLSKVELPSTLTLIGNYGFFNCAFSDIDLPEELEAIGSGAFAGCGNLKEMRIPESVKYIGPGAFKSCRSLQEVFLPSSLLTLSQELFVGCTKLKALVIPKNVTMIEKGALDGCESLDSIIILSTTPPDVATDMELLPEERYTTTILAVPKNSKIVYQSHKVWGKFKNIIENDHTTMVYPLTANSNNVNKYFDLSGRRLAAPPAKGMYIENGRKIMK